MKVFSADTGGMSYRKLSTNGLNLLFLVGVLGAVLVGLVERAPRVSDPVLATIDGSRAQQVLIVRVDKVLDGRTFRATHNGRQLTVRLLGIEVPQRARRGEAEQCGVRESRRALRELLSRYKTVVLVTDPSQHRRDGHGRLLAYVEVEHARTAQEHLLREGWATVLVVHSRSFRRRGAFQDAEERGRKRGAGLWQTCAGE